MDASKPMPSTVTFALVCEHQKYLIEVKPGSTAAEDMRRQVTALTGVDDDRLVTFNVRLPSSGRPSQPAAVQHASLLRQGGSLHRPMQAAGPHATADAPALL